MLKSWTQKLFLPCIFIIWVVVLANVDRTFFKRDQYFCLRFLYSSFPADNKWDTPPLTLEQEQFLDEILQQKFRFLAKGAQSFAFISEDQKYVFKFHHYPSCVYIFPWLSEHVLSYQFSPRRKKIKIDDLEKLKITFTSYRDSYVNLQEETGIILAHVNRNTKLNRWITLIDKNGADYQVSLDEVTFLLQHKADLIYPKLDRLMTEGKMEEGKKIVSQIIQLLKASCQKGYTNRDPVINKNFGLLSDKAIYIDVGDLVTTENIEHKEHYIPYVKWLTGSFCEVLKKNYPELEEHYHREIERL